MCHGRTAKVPYIFELSKTPVYTIEEMSYYIYEHIYEIHEDFLNDLLVKWVDEELGMPALAKKLQLLQAKQRNLKDIVVTILCSNDYYMEKEIKEMIQVIDLIMDLNPLERRKLQGDQFLKYGMYQNAEQVYEGILRDSAARELKEAEFGNILHNLAITHVHIASYQEAAMEFKEAYNLNHNKESLRQYLLTLKLAMEDKEFKKELLQYQVGDDYEQHIVESIVQKEEEAKNSNLYQFLEHLNRDKEDGNSATVREKMGYLLAEWKQEYRRGRQQ